MSSSMWRKITEVNITVHFRQVHSHCSQLTEEVIKVGIQYLVSNSFQTRLRILDQIFDKSVTIAATSANIFIHLFPGHRSTCTSVTALGA